MGVLNCTSCRASDSEEEFISKVFSLMVNKDHDVNQIYTEFINCLITDRNQEKIELPKFENFINKFTSHIEKREAQIRYFQTLISVNGCDSSAIKRIGTILIFVSNGAYIEKVSLLGRHIEKYYGTMDRHIRDFITDVIDLNTDICLLSFKEYIDQTSFTNFSQIWKKPKKQKLIIKFTSIYDEIKNSNSEKNTSNLINKFLLTNYNNLVGDSIRDYLQADYMTQ